VRDACLVCCARNVSRGLFTVLSWQSSVVSDGDEDTSVQRSSTTTRTLDKSILDYADHRHIHAHTHTCAIAYPVKYVAALIILVAPYACIHIPLHAQAVRRVRT
jgi:hypothetical protein